MRFILLACSFLALPTMAVSETLKMTAPQEGKALGNLDHRKSSAAPATIEELFSPQPAAKKPPPLKLDAPAMLRDIDAKLDAIQPQIDKLKGMEGIGDDKLQAMIDRLNAMSTTLAVLQKKAAGPEDGGHVEINK